MAGASGTSTPRLFPSTRFTLAIVSFLGCMVVYSLRTSLSMAIVCMVDSNKTTTEARCPDESSTPAPLSLLEAAQKDEPSVQLEREFKWDPEIQGTLMGGFFYGYLGSQILGGIIAARFGAKRVILYAVLLSGVFTLMSPVAARSSPWALFIVRVIIGFMQGAIFPAMHTMWSVWAPPQEVSVLTSVTYAGTQFGNIVTMPLGGFLCTYGPDNGWPSIFYLLGVMGVLWCAIWQLFASDRPTNHPRISEEEKEYIESSKELSMGKASSKPPPTPWLSILTSRAVWAAWIGHFAGDWGAYTMLVSLPSFLNDVLGVELSALGTLAAVPYIAYFIVINVGGFLSDYIRQKGILSTLNTRRAAMLVALVGQAIFLVLSSYVGCGSNGLVVFYLTIGMALSGLQFSGFVVNYLDIAPPFSGTIMGIGNTLSCTGGIISPLLTGFIVQNARQSEWQTVMWVTAAILVGGSLIFCLFAKGEVEPWARTDQKTETEMVALNKSDDTEK